MVVVVIRQDQLLLLLLQHQLVELELIFKTEIKDKVGTVGIGSTAISGIDPSSILLVILNRAFDGSFEIDETFTVIGVTTDSIELNKSPANTKTLVRTFDFGLYQDQQKAIASTVVSAGRNYCIYYNN